MKPIKNAHQLMPVDKISNDILLQRAKALAITYSDESNNKLVIPYVKFKVGNECYGVAFQHLEGVVSDVKFVRPPNANLVICGVINYRGYLTPIIELGRLLNGTSSQQIKGPVIVVKDKSKKLYAISIDEISGSDYYTPDEQDYVNKNLSTQETKKNYILGVHKGYVAILSMESLLSTVQFE